MLLSGTKIQNVQGTNTISPTIRVNYEANQILLLNSVSY